MSGAVRLPARALALLGLTLFLGSVSAGPAVAAEPAFGTAPVVATSPAGTPATVSAVATGRHAGFDRVVFRVSGPSLGYDVRYAARLVEDPTGRVLPLAGSAVLTVTLQPTRWMDTPSPRVNRTDGFPALRQIRYAGEFEAVVNYGLGQAGRDGFRVFRLTGPDRIVIDLRHPAGAASPTAGTGTGTGTGAGPGAATDPGTATDPGSGAGTGAATGTGADSGTATGTGAGAEPADDTGDGFPLPAVVVGVLAAGLLAAAGIALRAR